MKTAKDWMETFDPAWEDRCGERPELTMGAIETIQLDAFRAGMEHAAKSIDGLVMACDACIADCQEHIMDQAITAQLP